MPPLFNYDITIFLCHFPSVCKGNNFLSGKRYRLHFLSDLHTSSLSCLGSIFSIYFENCQTDFVYFRLNFRDWKWKFRSYWWSMIFIFWISFDPDSVRPLPSWWRDQPSRQNDKNYIQTPNRFSRLSHDQFQLSGLKF